MAKKSNRQAKKFLAITADGRSFFILYKSIIAIEHISETTVKFILLDGREITTPFAGEDMMQAILDEWVEYG